MVSTTAGRPHSQMPREVLRVSGNETKLLVPSWSVRWGGGAELWQAWSGQGQSMEDSEVVTG